MMKYIYIPSLLFLAFISLDSFANTAKTNKDPIAVCTNTCIQLTSEPPHYCKGICSPGCKDASNYRACMYACTYGANSYNYCQGICDSYKPNNATEPKAAAGVCGY